MALYETFRDGHVVWRYPPRLVGWILLRGVDCVRKAATGPDDRAAATLTALLDVADQLPDT